MSIAKLVLVNFRNLEQGTTNLHPKINFFVGDNGSGKSSLLEAIFYLGHGKSFRTTKADSLVCHHQSSFVISIKDDKENQLGISRDFVTNEVSIKINGQRHNRLSELAKSIAVQIVTPESFKLFFGGPKERRRFVDLGLFHVEHEFSEQWKIFSRILKQRNACLRSQSKGDNLNYWTQAFCQQATVIAEFRKKYIETLTQELDIWLKELLPNIEDNIQVQYQQGWTQKKDLVDVLSDNLAREYKMGFSLYGPQKFDIKFLIEGIPLENKLSRGQQKLFLLALTLAQTKLIEKVKQVKPILLIDDIGAELDINSRRLLANAINRLDCQVMITAIEKSVLDVLVPTDNNFNMFHVEHGKLSAISE
ncbi:DNA replication/repair protein RecF [Thalassotalea sp. PLHSN55]|uniref:DNA replication/repair protein RecF n=1 Tax=Thalassotalea sp. PLHSN55 TaxID=3435888 RepID=UPI003F86593E